MKITDMIDKYGSWTFYLMTGNMIIKKDGE